MNSEPFGDKLMKFRHIRYGDYSFHAICPKCGELVLPDNSINLIKDGFVKETNALCYKCGRVEMPFDETIIIGDKRKNA